MKPIMMEKLTKEVLFPVVQAIPSNYKNRGFFKRLFYFITYRRKFKVLSDYCLYIPSLDAWLFIPKGFIYDGASVPKILNGVFSPTGMLLLGAAPHDFGYRYEGLMFVKVVDNVGELYYKAYSKEELDALFNELNALESGMKKASKTATFVLSLVGFTGWIENRRKNCNLHADFPELFIQEVIA